MPYHTLMCREDDGIWYPQFGDYDYPTVKAERDDYRSQYKAKDMRIVRTDDASLKSLAAQLWREGMTMGPHMLERLK